MATSVATVKYGTYTFATVPQIGIRDNKKLLGASTFGNGNIERSITLKGKLIGVDFNSVQTKIWALQAAFAKAGQALYIHDGTSIRINNEIVQPVSVEIPEDWHQYEAEFTIRLNYFPLTDTHYNPITVSYGSYTFSPIPAMGREYTVNRNSEYASRDSTKVGITLQGFIDKGSVSANFTEWNALVAALASDGLLTYGPFVQSVRVNKASYDPDVTDRRLSYNLGFDYDEGVGVDGVKKMTSTRSIVNQERVAIHHIPFVDDAVIQRIGRAGAQITANGSVVADTIANARTAAAAEIASQFPSASGSVETQRNITEDIDGKRVEWSVNRFYPIPALTGGVYGGNPVFS